MPWWTAMSTAIDATLTTLPWVLVQSLDMKMKEKWQVRTALAMSIFAAVASIVRTAEIRHVVTNNDVASAQSLDIYEISLT